MKLIAKTKKAKQVIKRAGTEDWKIIRSAETLMFFDGDSGHMIEPVLESTFESFKHARWIRVENDKDFDFEAD